MPFPPCNILARCPRSHNYHPGDWKHSPDRSKKRFPSRIRYIQPTERFEFIAETKGIKRKHTSDLFTQQYCNPPPPQTFNFQDIGLKPLEKTFTYPSDTSIGGRAFFTPTIGQLSPLKKSTGQNTVTVDCGSSGGQPQCRDQPMNSHYNSSPRPLPPVPQLLY